MSAAARLADTPAGGVPMPQQRQQPTEFPTGQQIQGATAVGAPEGADDRI